MSGRVSISMVLGKSFSYRSLVELGRIPAWLWMAAFLAACSGGETVQPKVADEALKEDIALVSTSRIYFGHQSVGGNIMDGLDDLQREVGQPAIRVGELDSLESPDGEGVLLHTKVGQNEKPISKCEDFRQILDQKLQGRIDVALFKFCYIDFNGTSDGNAIFDTYARTMDGLKQKYPDIVFIHVTAPLRSEASGPSVWIREMLGKPNRSKLANVSRNEFNRRLWERYAADPIFDLAAVMSTYPDGRRESFSMGGASYYSLVPAYTDDGGHLNGVGRTYAAAALIQSIAGALRIAKEPAMTANSAGTPTTQAR
jgi:hypothetical protein